MQTCISNAAALELHNTSTTIHGICCHITFPVACGVMIYYVQSTVAVMRGCPHWHCHWCTDDMMTRRTLSLLYLTRPDFVQLEAWSSTFIFCSYRHSFTVTLWLWTTMQNVDRKLYNTEYYKGRSVPLSFRVRLLLPIQYATSRLHWGNPRKRQR